MEFDKANLDKPNTRYQANVSPSVIHTETTTPAAHTLDPAVAVHNQAINACMEAIYKYADTFSSGERKDAALVLVDRIRALKK